MAADGKAEKKAKGGISIATFLILTLLGAGAGGFFGFSTHGLVAAGSSKPESEASPANAAEARLPSHFALKSLPPITANLAQPSKTWIRIESAIVIDKDMGPDTDISAAKMAEDITGFLRTLSVDQITGPSGFQHLREDLNDRVRVRSRGKVSELVIESLIVE